MSRARTLKPGFYANEQLADCSPFARLLFPGLWLLADKEGRLEDRHRQIKAKIFPFDDLDCDALLAELEKAGFIARYQVEENKFIQVLNFRKHQNPHPKETASTIPEMTSNVITRQVPETPERAGPSPLPSSPSLSPLSEEDAAVERARVRDAQERVLDALGLRNDPTWFGDAGIVGSWLRDGADLELDILPTINRLVAKRGSQGPPRSMKYFAQAIADSLASRTQPLPAGTPQERHHGSKSGPATGIAKGFLDALAEPPLDCRADRYSAEPLLDDGRGPSPAPGTSLRLVGRS